MKWQVVSVTILIAIGSTICYWPDTSDADATDSVDNDLSGESSNEGSEEEDEVENGEDESTETSLDPMSFNRKIKAKPKGQHKGDHLGQGDIMFRKGEEEAVFGIYPNGSKISTDRVTKAATRDPRHKWKLPIPYVVAADLRLKAKGAIKKAIYEFESRTCIRFRPKEPTDNDYLSFVNDDGCWSYVGRSGGRQKVSIGDGCEYKSFAVHEIMHALGFYHEQSRPDRNNYVKILFANIEKGEKHNFEMEKAQDITTFGLPYDYQSVMHYESHEFGITVNGKPLQTIVRKDKRKKQFGQKLRRGMSKMDAKKLKAMYC